MGIVLNDASVYVVVTEVNGHKNIYGHVLFASLDDANAAKAEAVEKEAWDNVWVTRWNVV